MIPYELLILGPRGRMKRREFITLLGGAAVTWPLTACGQQRERMHRIGVLLPTAADDAVYQARLAAFLGGLQQLGWADGRNVRIDTRWAASDLSKYAGELIALGPDVIMAFTSAAVPPLQQLTREIPIVFAIAGDPVGAGLVESLARPGGIDEVIVKPLVTKLR
jgi:putative tryptophan/tyrosine transport system substrate-binding protein